ncbi:expansin-like B1 [Magnolia sinica]|uniref:expansin-like B1 n=1 Tax=Magnolia sinica TaxID=86752 RepID=UPI00265ADB89|nr:expansin-like B1 [Magnolia sinica]
MALSFSLHSLLFIVSLLLGASMARAATCSDCFTRSRAAYYPNSDESGTDVGACGFGKFGAKVNGGDVSAASELFRNGVGCGACYQVRCTNSKYCSDKGVTVVITDSGSSDRTDFILSRRAFGRMAQTTDLAAPLLDFGVVDIEYRRVSCSYPNQNIQFKIDEASSFPNYLTFAIWYQQGKVDVIAVQLCETQNLACKLLERRHGAMWAMIMPPKAPLSIRMLVSGGEDGDETWVIPTNDIPQNWTVGGVYDSGIQLDL